jgi:hypothetical protein
VADLGGGHGHHRVGALGPQTRAVVSLILELIDAQDPSISMRGGQRRTIKLSGDPGPLHPVQQPECRPADSPIKSISVAVSKTRPSNVPTTLLGRASTFVALPFGMQCSQSLYQVIGRLFGSLAGYPFRRWIACFC